MCCDGGRAMLGTGLLCDLEGEVFAGLGAHSWIWWLVRSLPILVSLQAMQLSSPGSSPVPVALLWPWDGELNSPSKDRT